MHFNLDSGKVRGELFKPSGKWMYTVEIDMNSYYHFIDIYEAVKTSFLLDSKGIKINDGFVEAHKGWHLVVFEPYHRNSYPVMVTF